MPKRNLLLVVLGGALVLRLWAFDRFPVGFTADEASFGYDAYSLLKTGRDHWGESWPLALRSFGDFKPPLYTYLAIPSVAIFGLNEFAVRLPNAILGTLAVLFTYLLVVEIFKSAGPASGFPPASARRSPARVSGSLPPLSPAPQLTALLGSLLLAISPWHIMLSRGAFEANLTTFFIPLGIWAFLRGLQKPRWMMLAAFAFGLNLFSYHSARFFTPLLLLGLLWMYRHTLAQRYAVAKYKRSLLLRNKWSIIVFSIFLLLAVYTMFSGGAVRGADVAIFNPTDNWRALSERRYEAVLLGLPDSISRIFSNKGIYVAQQFVQNFLTYTSASFLFLQGAGEATYGMIPGVGVLYMLELLFIVAALISYVRAPNRKVGFFILWVLVGFLPASLSKGSGYAANRAAVVMPALQIISAYGILILFEWLGKKRAVLGAILALLVLSLASFLETYVYHSPATVAPAMSYGWKDAINFIKKVEANYTEIVVSRAFSEPQIFVAFYKPVDPNFVQKESGDWLRYQTQNLLFLDQLGEYHLGKYTFRDIHFATDKEKKLVLFVGKPTEFPQTVVPLETIYYPNGKPAILIVDPAKEVYATSY